MHGVSLVVATGGFSGCSTWASRCGGFSCCRTQTIAATASVAVALGPFMPKQVESPQTRAGTGVPCISRWILQHWTISGARELLFNGYRVYMLGMMKKFWL